MSRALSFTAVFLGIASVASNLCSAQDGETSTGAPREQRAGRVHDGARSSEHARSTGHHQASPRPGQQSELAECGELRPGEGQSLPEAAGDPRDEGRKEGHDPRAMVERTTAGNRRDAGTRGLRSDSRERPQGPVGSPGDPGDRSRRQAGHPEAHRRRGGQLGLSGDRRQHLHVADAAEGNRRTGAGADEFRVDPVRAVAVRPQGLRAAVRGLRPRRTCSSRPAGAARR